MRRLIHIPILHTGADLGSLSEWAQARYAKVLGPAGWSQRQQAVEQLWREVGGKVKSLGLDYANTRVYQDGLPVCGFERQIVEELAKAGSSNHQLVLELLDKGAHLVGTEDPQLLVQEYQLHRQQAQGEPAPSATGPQLADEAQRVLQARDRFLACRIAETLQAGETGLLFLGAAHRLDALEATDIRVEIL